MKSGLILLMSALLLNCEQNADQRHKIIFLSDISLKAEQDTIRHIVLSVLSKCNQYFQSDSLTISVSRSTIYDTEIIKKMGGVTGITYDTKGISIYIDSSVITWKETLKYAVAHEYNHAYGLKRFSNDLKSWDLLHFMVFEGKADCFAHLLYPNVSTPWTSALSKNEKSLLWDKLKPDLKRIDFTFNREVMFGSETYPEWGGYTLGYSIVQTAIKNNSRLTVKNWTDFSAEKILEMSDYNLSKH
jgi:uncharacterized protein YjaZ